MLFITARNSSVRSVGVSGLGGTARATRDARAAERPPFQFFPSCCVRKTSSLNLCGERTFNSFPVAAKETLRVLPVAVNHVLLSILSQLLRRGPASHDYRHAYLLSILSQLLLRLGYWGIEVPFNFQFFPSCCVKTLIEENELEPRPLSILSQLLPALG